MSLDPARVGRDASRIADEVIAHLAGQVGAEVTVTLEIEATLPDGASDQIVRTVTENSRTSEVHEPRVRERVTDGCETPPKAARTTSVRAVQKAPAVRVRLRGQRLVRLVLAPRPLARRGPGAGPWKYCGYSSHTKGRLIYGSEAPSTVARHPQRAIIPFERDGEGANGGD